MAKSRKNNTPARRKDLKIVYFLLRLVVVGILVAQIFNRDYNNVFLCVLTLLLFLIPSFLEKRVKINVPDTLEIIVLLFIFAAEILGEIREFYITFKYWDTMLHTLNGFLCAAIGLSLINILNNDKRFAISLSPFFVALVAFCFSMTIGVLWEFFEFGMDYLFSLDMQKDTFVGAINTVLLHPDGRNIPVNIPIESVVINGEVWPGYIDIGLLDTMSDLFVNFAGAFLFSILGFFYSKNERSRKIAEQLMLSVIETEEKHGAVVEGKNPPESDDESSIETNPKIPPELEK